MKSKRYGRDTVYAGNPKKIYSEVAGSCLSLEGRHHGYTGILGERIKECSAFLDPLTIAMGTNFIPRRFHEEISRNLKHRELDAISLLKISENLNGDFAENSLKKFHETLGELTPRETVHLTRVSFGISRFLLFPGFSEEQYFRQAALVQNFPENLRKRIVFEFRRFHGNF